MVECACKPSTGREKDLYRLKANPIYRAIPKPPGIHSKTGGWGREPILDGVGSVNPTLKKLRQEGHQKFKVITSYRINPYLKMNKSHSECGDTNMNRKNRGNNEKGY